MAGTGSGAAHRGKLGLSSSPLLRASVTPFQPMFRSRWPRNPCASTQRRWPWVTTAVPWATRDRVVMARTPHRRSQAVPNGSAKTPAASHWMDHRSSSLRCQSAPPTPQRASPRWVHRSPPTRMPGCLGADLGPEGPGHTPAWSSTPEARRAPDQHIRGAGSLCRGACQGDTPPNSR